MFLNKRIVLICINDDEKKIKINKLILIFYFLLVYYIKL